MANRSMSEKQRAELADAEILDGGVLSLQTAPPPEYRGVFKNPTDGIEFLHNDRQRCNLNPLTTSFSLDDGFLKDPPAPRGPWYPGQPGQSSGLSYSQRSAHLHPVEVTLSDQPYLANPRDPKDPQQQNQQNQQNQQQKKDGYYDYV